MEIKAKPVSNKSPAKKKVKKDLIYRHAYIYIAGIFLFIILGFYPVYFSHPGKADVIHQIHAFFAMSWMFLVITQTWLIGHKNVQWHRRLGKLSFVLAPLLVITAFSMIYIRLAKTPLGAGDVRLALAYDEIGLLLYFVLFYTLAIVNRHDFRRHQRFMVATTFVIIPPALGRVLVWEAFVSSYIKSGSVPDHLLSPWLVSFYSTIFIEAVVLILIFHDWRKNKYYFAYWFSFGFFLIQLVTVKMSLTWAWWLHFSRWLFG